MRIHNKDGGEVDACGNATRCVAWLLMGESGRDSAAIETNAGLLRAFDTGVPETVAVDMGEPRFGWREIPLARPSTIPAPSTSPSARSTRRCCPRRRR